MPVASVVATPQQPPVVVPSPAIQQVSAPAATDLQGGPTPSPQALVVAQAPTLAPAPREIVQVQPTPAVASPAPVAPAPAPAPAPAVRASVVPVAPPSETVSGEVGIRNTNVVIAGHIYECYGQQAHLACDLKH
jgi:hypothetical protein